MSNLETIKSMVINIKRQAEVQDLATTKGVDVSFSPVTWESVWFFIWRQERNPSQDGLARARTAAALYIRVTFRSDRPGDLVAVASREDGAPTFTKVPGASFEWTKEAMDAIDFHRCDRCNVRHDRVRVYLVCNPSGSDVSQLGGSCAKSAAERLRAQLGFLNEVVKLATNWGDEDLWTAGAAKWGNPVRLLALAEAVIQARGYVKSEMGEAATKAIVSMLDANPRTFEFYPDVMDALGRIDPGALQADVDAWLATLDDSEDFARNMKVAIQTGSYRLLGFLVYAPMGVRRMKEAAEAKKAKAKSFPYDPAADTLLARLETFTAEELKLSKRDATKVFEGAAPSKGGAAKLSKCLAGAWTVMSARTMDGFYGPTTFVTFQRADGARLTWKASGDVDADVGASFRLRGSVVPELLKSTKWGDERRIQRVTMMAVS